VSKYYRELESVFSKHVQDYDSWYFRNVDIAYEELNLVKSFNLRGVGLEIGSGTCFFSRLFGESIVGLDLSSEMCRFCKKVRGTECIHAIGEYLPVRSHSLDYVLIIVTLCFVDDVHRVLNECCRVLKKGGKVLICIVPRDSEAGRKYIEKSMRGHRFYKYAKFYTVNEVVALCKQHNLEVMTIRGTLCKDSENLKTCDFVCIHASLQ